MNGCVNDGAVGLLGMGAVRGRAVVLYTHIADTSTAVQQYKTKPYFASESTGHAASRATITLAMHGPRAIALLTESVSYT